VSHAPQQACPWKHPCGLLRRFAVGVLLGFLVFVALSVLRHFEIPLIQQLERAGNDAIVRFYASHLAREDQLKAVAIVLNDTEDEESRTSDLIDLITLLQSFDLSALVVDLQIKGDAASENGERLKRLARLLRESVKKFPVAVAANAAPSNLSDRWDIQRDYLSADGLGGIVRALPNVIEDSDGGVRSVAPWACAHDPDTGKWRATPTMAFALRGAPTEDCPRAQPGKDERLRILFRANTAPEASLIPVISLRRLTKDAAMDRQSLHNALVVVGQNRWADSYRTPVGVLPGVLVQANALWTAQRQRYTGESSHFDLIGESRNIVIVAFILGTLPFFQWLFLVPMIWAVRGAQHVLGVTARSEIPSIEWSPEERCPQPSTCSALGRAGLEFIAVSVGLALLLWPVHALMWPYLVRTAAADISSGSESLGFLPIFAAGLEGLIEVPEYLLRFLFLLVTLCSLFVSGRVSGRTGSKLLGVAGAGLLASQFVPAGARAEDAGQLSITVGNQDQVVVVRNNARLVPAGGLLQSYDTVQIDRAAEVEIRLFPLECNQTEQLKYPKAFYLVAPPPAECPQESTLHSFFEGLLWSPPERVRGAVTQLTRSIAGTPLALDRAAIVSRAAPGRKVAVPISGDLRPLPQLDARQARLLISGTGLALAWAGGTPPYEVAAELAETGEALGQGRAGEPYLWWPDWRMPPKPVTLTVTDASGRELHGTLLPAEALPAGRSVASTADVIALFQDGDDWRLESLRQLAALSVSDKLAAQALAAIRVSAKDE
jgi:hypothetical protein